MENIKKKILLLSTGDINGAYEAIYKLAYFFIEQGHTVSMLVKHKTKKNGFIVQYLNEPKSLKRKSLLKRIFIKVKNKIIHKFKDKTEPIHFDGKYSFISKDEASENISTKRIVSQIGFIPDFIITGMTDGFINSTDLLNLHKLTNAKVYNITVDMNHFTGGCHYAWDCEGYIKGCDEKCPAIIGKNGRDLAKINFETKLKNVREGRFEIISGSGWTLKQAQESKIYKEQKVFHNINSLIDTKLFNAKNRDIAKRVFGFESSKFYILAGSQNANDPRKGFPYFIEALKILEAQLTVHQKNKIVILVVSRDVPQEFEYLNFEKQKLDYITDYRLLVLLYQAIDLFVNSSIEDSGPMMVSEAMACGTPVVGFDMGVVNNIVINDYNGYKAILKDSNDLASGIKKMINLTTQEYTQYSKSANTQIQQYSSFEFATKIFNEIINT
ncbi:glycosyltransferase [Flavobacterium sp. HJJ]|uniref:glycosyltransferase n=1 Tax=Flavobacterium sp. HJJ TaxID=2783792 RepID=UPI00188CA8BB|nr:glycosyltransferase [Flavobacterium sp. HJJ]MBF4470287.1 glycosyltransferase [Flavobacterium sp. HJJ]